MAYYSIGDVAERCGINPVTLRAWQRRYGLLKPQRSEGGHRLFDEEDIQRIEEIKRWIRIDWNLGFEALCAKLARRMYSTLRLDR